jgi:hypothetical protein
LSAELLTEDEAGPFATQVEAGAVSLARRQRRAVLYGGLVDHEVDAQVLAPALGVDVDAFKELGANLF